MKHYVIEVDGERQVVKSLKGYENPTVLGETKGPPGEYDDWDDKAKKFVKNADKEKAAKRKAKARDCDALLDMIEDLQQRVAALEALAP